VKIIQNADASGQLKKKEKKKVNNVCKNNIISALFLKHFSWMDI